MKKYIFALALVALTATACNDDFLEKYPKTEPTEETAFETYDNFKAFMMPCYGMFASNYILTTASGGYGSSQQYRGDVYAGYLTNKGTGSYNGYAFQTIGETVSDGGWNFEYIRRINMMLSHLESSSLSSEEKDHWKAVGYYFHSYWYMMLINRFGDVSWVNTLLTDSSEENFDARMPRMQVADSVLHRLQWAETHIKVDGEGASTNTINRDVVRATLSRFTLREGTWRKYHGLGDYSKYLEECSRVSQLLMAAYPSLYYGTDGQPAAGYGEMWTTEDLGKVNGVILYYQLLQDYRMGGTGHVEHTSSATTEMPQHIVDMYLTKDGLPIGNAADTLYAGDKTMYATFRDRDPRLYHTCIPPYTVQNSNKIAGRSWGYTADDANNEYIKIMGENASCSNPGVGMKRLPAQNWGASLVPHIPNLEGMGAAGTTGFVACRSGYYIWKNYNNWETNYNQANLNTADKPIFKIEEVLLNYAECKFEQGAFSQAIADQTINKLRDRAGVAKMTVSKIDANFDPNRDKGTSVSGDYEVDPVLWEIRRERMIELMGEGFGFDDVRRWMKAPYWINKQAYGMWVNKSTMGLKASINILGSDGNPDASINEGYIYLFADPVKSGKGWLDKYYLYQVPKEEILLNPNLTQNPGWD